MGHLQEKTAKNYKKTQKKKKNNIVKFNEIPPKTSTTPKLFQSWNHQEHS